MFPVAQPVDAHSSQCLSLETKLCTARQTDPHGQSVDFENCPLGSLGFKRSYRILVKA